MPLALALADMMFQTMLIFVSNSIQLKLISENGSLKFELEDSGKELLNNFRMETEKQFNIDTR
ncbi:hypothetical protein [Leptospira santarosai]|uniref:hypothetical protein n=1 Tax=Leptospira santarosai TaxID=28183 RepID=UPI0024AF2BD2|nr:hypothetical protein [Leptospira santarosai]